MSILRRHRKRNDSTGGWLAPSRACLALGALALAGALATPAAAAPLDDAAPRTPVDAAEELLEAAESAERAIQLPTNARLILARAYVYKRPGNGAPIIHEFGRFRDDFRPTVVYVLARRKVKKEELWYRVLLPGRPNGRKGWLKASDVRLNEPPPVEIVVRRGDRMLELRRGKRTIFKTKVAVGKPGAETPLGRFYIAASFKPGHRFLGVHAFETSAYSRLSDWPGGGIVGIHGTYQPELLGQAVSHGCIRVSNGAVLRLKRLTPLGAPVSVIP